MSFCIRSISSGGRYVPTFVANAQGCTARSFSSRQLPKHVNPVATSTFLNEFLGSNVPLTLPIETRDEYKLSNTSRESLSNVHTLSSSVPVNNIVDGYHLEHINSENGKSCELFPQEINRIPYLNPAREQLIFSNASNSCDSQVPIVNQENSWIHTNPRINTGIATKDKTKVRFATVTKTATALKERSTNVSSKTKTDDDKKTNDNLEYVYKVLSLDLPNFFSKPVDYKIYHPDIEFVNNIRGTTTKGLYNYIKQMALLRTVGHIRYAYVALDVLKITMHTTDNTVRVRWRINGITGMKVLFSFWKFNFWKIRESFKEQETWYDGFSTFYVGEDGLVYKHVADKMMPDEETDDVKTKGGIQKLASQLTFSSLE